MRNIQKYLTKMQKLAKKAGGVILLLDFDGVLSAIAPTPEKAFISKENKVLVKECTRNFSVAIITGRELTEIKKKIGLKNILYIARHGLEWEENRKYHAKSIPKKTIKAINLAKKKIQPLMSTYPGMIFEDKSFMFSIHYRIMNPKLVKTFIRKVNSILKPITKQYKLRLEHNLKTFELRPEINWDKGNSALFAEEYFNKKTGKKLIPIYIGDSLTDEDAFSALRKNGITIRVGKNTKSKARWYLKNQKGVSIFLKWLLSLNL